MEGYRQVPRPQRIVNLTVSHLHLQLLDEYSCLSTTRKYSLFLPESGLGKSGLHRCICAMRRPKILTDFGEHGLWDTDIFN